MPLPIKKTYAQLRAQSLTLLENSGRVTNLAEGGVARTLLDITNTQLAEFYSILSFNASMSRLSTATGVFLDLIGQSRGVTRLTASGASVSAEDKVIRFYSADEVTPLGTYIASIPVGTLITSTDGEVTYEVSTQPYFNSIATEVYVDAVSSGTGADQNVGKNVLVLHDLGDANVLVTNDVSINNAADVESDNNYRFRISRSSAIAAGGTEDAIKVAAFSVPGVSSVQLRPFPDGVGTFEVLVVPIGNSLTTNAIKTVEALVNRAAAYGTKVTVRTPTELPVDLTIQLQFVLNTTDSEKVSIKDQVRRAVLTYLADIGIGGIFVINELTQRIMDVNPKLFDMKILLYRFRNESMVLKNIQAEADELFLPNPESNNPIIIL